MDQTAYDKIKKALTMLLIWNKHPAPAAFFSSICLQVPLEECPSVTNTMATDGKRFAYDPVFVKSMSEKELMGVLVHEALHIAYFHHTRMGNRDKDLWNIAADLAINPTCLELGLSLPDGVLIPGQDPFQNLPKGLSAEEYYLKISETLEKKKSKGSSPSNPQKGDDYLNLPKERFGEVIKPGKATETEIAQAEAQARLMVEAAHQIAKARGDLPGMLSRIVSNAKPKVCWRTVLQDFLTKLSKHKQVWQRPNKRFYPEVYLPSLGGRKMSSCVFLIDTSCSISTKLLVQFAAEVNSFRTQMLCPVHVLWHDTKVYKTESLEAMDSWEPKVQGGGGTYHHEAFAKALELEPEIIVSLTDCYSAYPKDPGVQSLFLRYGSGGTAPEWGTVVDMEE